MNIPKTYAFHIFSTRHFFKFDWFNKKHEPYPLQDLTKLVFFIFWTPSLVFSGEINKKDANFWLHFDVNTFFSLHKRTQIYLWISGIKELGIFFLKISFFPTIFLEIFSPRNLLFWKNIGINKLVSMSLFYLTCTLRYLISVKRWHFLLIIK